MAMVVPPTAKLNLVGTVTRMAVWISIAVLTPPVATKVPRVMTLLLLERATLVIAIKTMSLTVTLACRKVKTGWWVKEHVIMLIMVEVVNRMSSQVITGLANMTAINAGGTPRIKLGTLTSIPISITLHNTLAWISQLADVPGVTLKVPLQVRVVITHTTERKIKLVPGVGVVVLCGPLEDLSVLAVNFTAGKGELTLGGGAQHRQGLVSSFVAGSQPLRGRGVAGSQPLRDCGVAGSRAHQC